MDSEKDSQAGDSQAALPPWRRRQKTREAERRRRQEKPREQQLQQLQQRLKGHGIADRNASTGSSAAEGQDEWKHK
eukprot:8122479-Alexandrium_andersonii.AAC.1